MCTLGQMVKSMTVSGLKESKKDLEFGKEPMEITMLESGKMVKLKVMEFIPGKMVIDTKVNGKIV